MELKTAVALTLEFYKQVFKHDLFSKIINLFKNNKIKIIGLKAYDDIEKYFELDDYESVESVFGYYDDENNIIYINLKIMEERKYPWFVLVSTLIHEMSHLVYFNFELKEIFDNLIDRYKKEILEIIELAGVVIGAPRPDNGEKLYIEDELIAYYFEYKYLKDFVFKDCLKCFDKYLERFNFLQKIPPESPLF